jgi:hypothetical protein
MLTKASALPARGQQVPHAAQVALALLAHGADEENRALGLNPRLVERARDGEQRRQPAAVVGHAGRAHQPRRLAPHEAVRPLGEDRVEVRAQDEQRLSGAPAPEREAVPLGVEPRAFEPARLELRAQVLGARALAERGRGHGDYRGVLLVELGGALLEKTERTTHGLRPQQAAHGLLRRHSRGGGNRHIRRVISVG